ncbi:hypothetical protein COXBURSA331_A0760 [Coxiella burnetii RSA 331]|nr:hypothetical protein COXBURSA331_A0760 [Coxiella burnetii RSA 331]
MVSPLYETKYSPYLVRCLCLLEEPNSATLDPQKRLQGGVEVPTGGKFL